MTSGAIFEKHRARTYQKLAVGTTKGDIVYWGSVISRNIYVQKFTVTDSVSSKNSASPDVCEFFYLAVYLSSNTALFSGDNKL